MLDTKTRNAIAESLVIEIDEYSDKTLSDTEPRRHLGASIIGKPCSRELYYGFRNFVAPDFSSATRHNGQVMRLFQRGHQEEPRVLEYLTGIGCVCKFTPEDQQRVTDVSGHFGGSLDNIIKLPPKYGIDEDILLEIKTSNEAEFIKTRKLGFKSVKPVHWSQVCVYGYKMQLRYCMYLMVNKNTDAIHIELVETDLDYGEMMVDKAASIITALEPPPKIAMVPTNWSCKWCVCKDVCHNGAEPLKHCKTCVHSVPLENAQWGCELYGPIPDNILPIGCPKYEATGSK